MDNVNVHRAAAKINVSKSRAARGSVCNVLLSRGLPGEVTVALGFIQRNGGHIGKPWERQSSHVFPIVAHVSQHTALDSPPRFNFDKFRRPFTIHPSNIGVVLFVVYEESSVVDPIEVSDMATEETVVRFDIT